MYFSIIYARGVNGEFGFENKLPWNIPDDLKHFKQITSNSTIIMGYNTFKSLPSLLPNRKHIIITSKEIKDVTTYKTFNDCLKEKGKKFVIGGKQLIEHVLEYHCQYIDTLYETIITSKTSIKADVFLDLQLLNFDQYKTSVISTGNTDEYSFTIYKRTLDHNKEERTYLNLMSELLAIQHQRQNRTNIATLSKFGTMLTFDISDSFPLFTTRTIFFRGVFEELMWFIRGQTDSKILEKKNIFIWKGNTSREFLDSRNLQHLEEGSIGKGYGYQWRKSGVDQLAYVINLLKTDPNSRRILLSAWNPSELDQMVLPPCHYAIQFYVEDGKLHSLFNMRSCDLFHGFPFNIASYSLLTLMLGEICGYSVGTIKCCLGDYHIYSSHIDSIEEQIQRNTRKFPKLVFKKHHTDIEKYEFEDVELIDYKPHPTIKTDMVV